MATLEKSITINAPVDKVFAYLDEPTAIPEWLPSMMEVKDVTGTGADQRFRWTYKMAGLPFHGEATNIEYVQNERTVTENKGGITSTWTNAVEPDGEGTKLTMHIEYTIPVPVLGKLAESVLLKRDAREIELALANIKETLEG